MLILVKPFVGAIRTSHHNETAVSSDYEPASSKFTGQIESVTIALSTSKLTATEQKAIGNMGEATDKADD